MTLPSAHFAALRYLTFWFDHDKEYTEQLRSGNCSESRRKALISLTTQYKVIRTLPKAPEGSVSNRLGPALELLDSASLEGDPCQIVLKFEDQLRAFYGERRLLSAASKILWHRHFDRSFQDKGIIIYDSNALEALKAVQHEPINPFDYKTFRGVWLKTYDNHFESIKEACDKISRVKEYLRFPDQTSEEDISRMASEDWFRQRVFDFMLWRHKSLSSN